MYKAIQIQQTNIKVTVLNKIIFAKCLENIRTRQRTHLLL